MKVIRRTITIGEMDATLAREKKSNSEYLFLKFESASVTTEIALDKEDIEKLRELLNSEANQD